MLGSLLGPPIYGSPRTDTEPEKFKEDSRL